MSINIMDFKETELIAFSVSPKGSVETPIVLEKGLREMLTLQPRTVLTLSFVATMSAISLPLAKAQTTVSSLTPPSSTESSKASASPNGDLRLEVERLEMLVHEQQKRIDALEAEHHPANVEALESSSTA